MNTNEADVLHKDLSYKIVGIAMEVHRKLGQGFLEKVYENAIIVLCRRDCIPAMQQAPLTVKFEGTVIGDYFADILVDDKIILELKVADAISDAHRAQVLNYLKATGLRLAIIMNFGKTQFEFEHFVN